MNETEIKEKVRAAMGDSPYPHELTHRVTSRLGEPARQHPAPRLVGVVAAFLAVAIVATLVYVRFQSSPRPVVPAATPQVSPYNQWHVSQANFLPQIDLDRAQLSSSGDLVTQPNLSSTSNGRTVTLIGAYADHARTVLFFRSMPVAGIPNVMVYDSTGFINAASGMGQGSIGDTFFTLDAGPHVDSDGMAHLRVSVDSFMDMPAGQQTNGTWTFSFSLSPAATTGVTLTPPLTAVGSWKVTVEALEVTPSLIHFQAVIAGAAVEDITQETVQLTDTTGQHPRQLSMSAGTTVPKSQLGSTPPRSTRVNITWARPATSMEYVLTVAGGGSQSRGTFSVPAPTPSASGKKGTPLAPTDYPVADEFLKIDGAFSDTIVSANPNMCGAGDGNAGQVFAFGAWFQVDGAWYSIVAYTDPLVRQYTGPGTYQVNGTISPYAPLGAAPIFEGPIQLTVTSDKRPGPQTGTLRGTMTWTGASSPPVTINISGGWTCTFSTQLGPG